MKKRLSMTIAALALAIAPSAAWADGYFVPFIGPNFGGNVGRPLSETVDERNRFSWGFGVGGMAGGIFGAEFDFGYTHNFYASDGAVVTKSNLITAMPSLVIGIPVGGQHGAGIRPYFTAGLGLLRTQIDGGTLGNVSSSDNGLGWNAGGGVMGYFTDHVGVRGDIRYMRGFNEQDLGFDSGDNLQALRFWRASVGVVFR